MEERLQKILSARGIASRRKAEEYITRGLVTVNGHVATLGQKADPAKDTIAVDGKVLEERASLLYYLLNKPVSVETSNVTSRESLVTEKRRVTSDQRQTTVRDLLPTGLQGKIYPVGRLDKETSGLLLLTNDGVLAYRLTHPKFDHEKEYEVVTEHPIADGALHKLGKGITIDGTKTKPAKVRRISPSSFRIALTEGRNRQIRRMCQKVGSPVRDLRRVRIMTIEDRALKPGQLRVLQKKEVEGLLKAVGLHP
ncbi:MAG TPA: pseudouridine synthase [Candidatus Peribacteraceae bacterium]|nr:pseudouridine synthase [Candidatus Peribacteraceae bacterium]